MHLTGIMAGIERFELNGSSIETDITSFRAAERSGFVLDNLSGKFRLDNGYLEFTDANILTTETNLFFRISSCRAIRGPITNISSSACGSRVCCAIRSSPLLMWPIFARVAREIRSIERCQSGFSGRVDDFDAKIRSLRLGRHTFLAADVAVQGLPDFRQSHFDVQVSRLSTVSSEVQQAVADFTGKSLSPKIVDILANAGNMNLAVQFKGTPSLFRVNMGAETAVGKANFDLALQPYRDGLRSIDGNVAARNLRLGELLGRTDLFGDASLSARIDGVIGRRYADAQVDGTVDRLTFNDYTYDTLHLDGRLFNKRFDGRISARDPHLNFDFSGLLDFNEQVPRYDFLLSLYQADLAQLRINRRDSVSQLAARIVARGSGRSLDDMNGTIRISDVVYRYNDKTLRVDSLAVRGKNSMNSKYVELRSDFADVTFRSKTSYREVFAYLRQSAGKYLPRSAIDGKMSVKGFRYNLPRPIIIRS